MLRYLILIMFIAGCAAGFVGGVVFATGNGGGYVAHMEEDR